MDITSTLYRNYTNLIDFNFNQNIHGKSVFLLIGLSSISINDKVLTYSMTKSELSKAFELYDPTNSKNIQNALDQYYIKLTKFVHEQLEIPLDDLNQYVDAFITDYVTNISENFENLIISSNTFKYSQDELNIETTHHALTRFLFGKGITRLRIFDYSITSGIIEDFVKNNHESENIYHVYLACLLVTLQVFSDGNHRTAYDFLKNKIYIRKDDFMKLIKDFRTDFRDSDYTNYDEESNNIMLLNFAKSLKPYINKRIKHTTGGYKKSRRVTQKRVRRRK